MSITSRSTDRGLLVLRLVVALIFIAHGYMKLFVMGHAGVTGFFTQLGIPLPSVAAWAISLLEFGGGIALALGIFTRPLALLFVCDMVTAILLVLLPKGLVGGYELELLLAAGSLALAFAGAGAYSLDARSNARGA
ncbi:MAG: DoxX family protein [Gemmatimonadaceae bacterium]